MEMVERLRWNALSRGRDLVAFNFIESLLIELIQERLRESSVSSEVKREIEKALRNGRAAISSTIKEWPVKVGKSPVHKLPEFACFDELRQLRNNLTHPKLDPLKENELNQDQLLQRANAKKAAWAVSEVKKMGKALYQSFGIPVPIEIQ